MTREEASAKGTITHIPLNTAPVYILSDSTPNGVMKTSGLSLPAFHRYGFFPGGPVQTPTPACLTHAGGCIPWAGARSPQPKCGVCGVLHLTGEGWLPRRSLQAPALMYSVVGNSTTERRRTRGYSCNRAALVVVTVPDARREQSWIARCRCRMAEKISGIGRPQQPARNARSPSPSSARYSSASTARSLPNATPLMSEARNSY